MSGSVSPYSLQYAYKKFEEMKVRARDTEKKEKRN